MKARRLLWTSLQQGLFEGHLIGEFAFDRIYDPDSRLLPARNSLQVLSESLCLGWEILINDALGAGLLNKTGQSVRLSGCLWKYSPMMVQM